MIPRPTTPRDRLIVALDVPTAAEAEALIARIGDSAGVYKIGLELLLGGGVTLAERLSREGKKVFLDAKFLDIDNTVAKAVANASRLGVSFLTIHAYPAAMRAAVDARGGSPLALLGVTVLTSMNDRDFAAAGYAGSVRGRVLARAADAKAAGMDGVVASPEEAAAIRSIVGDELMLVTPGIRPSGAALNDQKRAATPTAAIAAGADYLVVGRPITEAADPRAAADAIVAEIAATKAG
jgi:orotidine-5'-phosphate decarboxylase